MLGLRGTPPIGGTRMVWEVRSTSARETAALAEAFGRRAEPGHVFALTGPLGAGKTAFAAGLAAGLGVAEPVTSPTFVLVQRYEGRCPLIHVDAYRMDGGEEWRLLGLDDLLAGPVVAVIEWADRVVAELPADALWIAITPDADPDARRLTLRATGDAHAALLAAVREEWAEP